jgi:hypothetical protein
MIIRFYKPSSVSINTNGGSGGKELFYELSRILTFVFFVLPFIYSAGFFLEFIAEYHIFALLVIIVPWLCCYIWILFLILFSPKDRRFIKLKRLKTSLLNDEKISEITNETQKSLSEVEKIRRNFRGKRKPSKLYY